MGDVFAGPGGMAGSIGVTAGGGGGLGWEGSCVEVDGGGGVQCSVNVVLDCVV